MFTHTKTAFILIAIALTSGCLEHNDKSAEELLLIHSNIKNKDSILTRKITKLNRSTYCLELKAQTESGVYTDWGKTFIMLDDHNEFMPLTASAGILSQDHPYGTQNDEVANSVINVFCPTGIYETASGPQ
ncbi:hypothetical protein DFO61_2342 [Ectopseudomonas oleovorans]|uniref:Lipoprotein n=1 Tax=Ectopseudomonas oleovorans TaxID=301 RepID=A0A397N6G8_ECTOL|nr:hypothetical protein [Pseudomonas oleovorans]RIA31618.1 hypothetical protein DFO61_2342 [Pseudomonas oleovorans]